MEQLKALQNEIMVQRDSIWRLTTRIFNLEKEVRDLKNVVGNKSKPASIKITSALHRAKIREIARRKTQIKNSSNMKTSSPKSRGLHHATTSKVKTEQSERQNPSDENPNHVDSDTIMAEDESQPSEPEDCSEVSQGVSGAIKVSGSVPKSSQKLFSEDISVTDSSDSDSAEDREIKKSILKTFPQTKFATSQSKKYGRHLDDIWDLFTVNQVSKIQKQAICKACDKLIQWAKVETLRVHLRKCGKPKYKF